MRDIVLASRTCVAATLARRCGHASGNCAIVPVRGSGADVGTVLVAMDVDVVGVTEDGGSDQNVVFMAQK